MRRACFYISVAAMVALAVWLTFTGRLQNYLLVSWAVALAALALFFTQYERRRPALQDVMPIVIVVCVASLGRALFNFIPQMQPVTALVMIMGAVIWSGKRTLEKQNKEYQARVAQLQEQVEEQQNRSDEIDEYKKYIQTKKFAEEVAKDKFGMIYPDELVFKPEN